MDATARQRLPQGLQGPRHKQSSVLPVKNPIPAACPLQQSPPSRSVHTALQDFAWQPDAATQQCFGCLFFSPAPSAFCFFVTGIHAVTGQRHWSGTSANPSLDLPDRSLESFSFFLVLFAPPGRLRFRAQPVQREGIARKPFWRSEPGADGVARACCRFQSGAPRTVFSVEIHRPFGSPCHAGATCFLQGH